MGKYFKYFDGIILFFLTLQIVSVGFSVAVSSIAFGTWGGLWVIQLIAERDLHYTKEVSRELKVASVFLLVYCIAEILSRVFAVYQEDALIGSKRLFLFGIFFVTIAKVKKRETLIGIILTVLFFYSVISIIEIVRYGFDVAEYLKTTALSEIRVTQFGQPLTTGEIKMMILMSVTPLLFIKDALPVKKVYLWLMVIPVFIAMYLTQSRNVFLAVTISLFVYGLFFNGKFFIYYAAALIFLYFFLPPQLKDRVVSIVNPNHPSNYLRLCLWKTGLLVFKDHYLLGVGDSNLIEFYRQYKLPEYPEGHSHFHSNIIMLLVTTGAAGFLSITGWFVTVFAKQIKFFKTFQDETAKALIAGSILMMIAFHISGIFEWSFGDHEVMTVFLFLIAIPFTLLQIKYKEQ